jgi:hypothetical protein
MLDRNGTKPYGGSTHRTGNPVHGIPAAALEPGTTGLGVEAPAAAPYHLGSGRPQITGRVIGLNLAAGEDALVRWERALRRRKRGSSRTTIGVARSDHVQGALRQRDT